MAYQHEVFTSDPKSPSIEDDTEDDFLDALEEIEECKMDLETSLLECEVAIRKFFNNEFEEAKEVLKPWNGKSIYHSLGCSVFEFIPALLTFEAKQISLANQSLKHTISLCNKHRRNYTIVESIGTMLKKPDFRHYSDLEAHAELCYAESLLLHAVLTFIEDEDLAALIKGTLKIKSCYKSYKDCATILEKKSWTSDKSKQHFMSGVRMGVGSFNLMISLLPSKIISLLSFVGFNGNKAQGLAELEAGSREPGIRQPLCNLTLLGYNLILGTFIGAEVNFEFSERILKKQLELHPNGVWFLLFKARLEFMRGQLDMATNTYKMTIKSQNIWKELHHMCYWELLWISSLEMRWRESASYCARLLEDSLWSKTTYLYQMSAMLLQTELSADEKKRCTEALSQASYYKQRIVGKSLPMEKFVIKRCVRYQNQEQNLVLPGLELMCLWNMFEPLAKNLYSAHNMLTLIEETLIKFEEQTFSWENGYEADNRALINYLHGCLLRHLGSPSRAIEAFDKTLRYKNEIKEDYFLLPFAHAEIGFCYMALNDLENAIHTLCDVKKKYSGYSLESRLQIRIHSKLYTIKAKLKGKKKEI